jgi:catechol 2,3-dioxygenase-like lactoylglutathione lyase family enzyme
MTTRLEHANIVVRDIDAAIRFLQTALPDFAVRHDTTPDDGLRWVHLGNADAYIALTQSQVEPAEAWAPYEGKPGVNHLAFVVEDAEALRARMRAAGYRDATIPNAHPWRKRVYFRDPDGNDWEFVEYLSDTPALRNDYRLRG